MNMNRRKALATFALFIGVAFGTTACSDADKTYADGPAASDTTVSAPAVASTTEAPAVTTPTDSNFRDHVTTNKCDPGKASDGFLGRVHVRATIKNILDDGDATYVLNYKVFDSQGMQVAAVSIDATAFNGPIAYGDTTQVDDHYSASTGDIPSDGRFTCKLFRVDRMVS